MKLFYSIISKADQPQSDPMYSLGGFCSSSPVQSGVKDAVFSTVSEYTIENPKPQFICLILKNVMNCVIENAQLWIDNPEGNQCKYKVGLAADLNGEFESVQSIYQRPVYVEFTTVNGKDDSITLPRFEQGKMLALWIERTINLESDDIKNRTNCDYLFQHREDTPQTEEKLNLKIEW